MLPHLPLWIYLIVGALFVLVLGRSMSRQTLRIDRLWIVPASLVFLTAVALSQHPATSLPMLALYGSAMLAGAALGWWRGQFTLVTVNPKTEVLTGHTSRIGMAILLGVVGIRLGIRAWVTEHASAFNMTVGEVTDAFLLFAVGLVCAERVEVAIRATRALNDARHEKRRQKIAPLPAGQRRRRG
ncbi:hypothetical protein [Phenylobacterium sp.]|jgi:hypothetical protein|uniref:hypothetical protein n=1 Tax=Phenylobacterium sp. TaxID=1871053 RepID=UPI002F95A983